MSLLPLTEWCSTKAGAPRWMRRSPCKLESAGEFPSIRRNKKHTHTHLERSGLQLSQYQLPPTVHLFCFPAAAGLTARSLVWSLPPKGLIHLLNKCHAGKCARVSFTQVISNNEDKTTIAFVNEWMQWLKRLILRVIMAPASALEALLLQTGLILQFFCCWSHWIRI